MHGRERGQRGRTDASPPPDPWRDPDHGARRLDGPVSFELARVERSGRRSKLPLVVLSTGVAGLVVLGVAGRQPTSEAVVPIPSTTAVSSVAPGPDGPGPGPSTTTGRDVLILMSPSRDEAVAGRLTVLGFVRGEGSRDVSIVLGAGERVVASQVLASAPRVGDSTRRPRTWFETDLGVATLPIGWPLWLEVGLIDARGEIAGTIRRSIRVGSPLGRYGLAAGWLTGDGPHADSFGGSAVAGVGVDRPRNGDDGLMGGIPFRTPGD